MTDWCARLVFAAGFRFCRELVRFFMAGLLCTSSAYLGAYRIPWTPAFSLENSYSRRLSSVAGRFDCDLVA